MKALIIIDMQQGSFTPATPRYDAEKVIDRINQLSSVFRNRGDAVIFIQHDGTANGDFIPGTEEWSLLADLNIESTDIHISKTANDCFYRSTLDAWLREHDVEELAITGCATDFCVDATIKSAFTKEYHVTVISDAHTTANRDEIGAGQLIAHYNWVWQNMLPLASAKLCVMSCSDYISSI